MNKNKDLKFGLSQEEIIHRQLESHFNIKLDKTKKYDLVDFVNDDYIFELKCRRVYRMSYPTTMIGQNKIDYMLSMKSKGKKCFCVFNFINGLYYIELTDDNIKLLNMGLYGGRSDRGDNEYKKNGYCYIPSQSLTKINTNDDIII